MRFIEKKTGILSKEIDSIDNLLKEKNANEAIVVFGGDVKSNEFNEYINASSLFEYSDFFHTTIKVLNEAIEKENKISEGKIDKNLSIV